MCKKKKPKIEKGDEKDLEVLRRMHKDLAEMEMDEMMGTDEEEDTREHKIVKKKKKKES